MLKVEKRGQDALLGGVLAGLAHHWQVSKSLLRILFFLAFVLLNFIPFMGWGASMAPVLLYILLWLSMPEPSGEFTEIEQEKKAVRIKTFYNYTMLGVVFNLAPFLFLALFNPDQLYMLLLTVPAFVLLLPATIFIIAGIIKAA
ncbi:PspC domain-containing protein [Desulfonatronospira sp.]|uniref:PspC domain-containing protein n=1 Tax=Desulfonatronospira sp. TaxID=1962951 RepID=UPI0025C6BBB9|nr:PspC domain-containing protein [Desulfonatronospira sp.]